MTRLLAILLILLWPGAALPDLTAAQIDSVALQSPPGARAPLSLTFTGLDGQATTLGDAIGGRPTLLLLADFTCTEICGPALSVAADALGKTELRAGTDYSVAVVGIDAQDSLGDARRFVSGQIGGPGVTVLTGDAPTIAALTAAIGYRFQRDDAHGAVAHPAGYVTLTADGRVGRPLSSLALQPTDLRLALIETGEGRIGGLGGRLALLCYGFDAVHGIYTRSIVALMQVAGGVTVAAMALAFALLRRRERRRGASA